MKATNHTGNIKTKTLLQDLVIVFTSPDIICLLLALLFAFAAGIAHG